MENRKQAILRAVVKEFTTSAVPVGSQALQSRYFVNLSSATIRSELAELADLGYLAQPHTSAGRVPTDSGYRYFVDFLMDLEAIPDSVALFIREELRKAPADVQGLVEKVAMTLAAVTQNASVASAPHGTQARVKHVDLVSLEPNEVLLKVIVAIAGAAAAGKSGRARPLTETKTYKRLGYDPISLDDGLRLTTAWLRQIGRID